MNLYKRSFLSIIRKPFKTVILIIIVFALANFLALSLIIKNSVKANEQKLISAIGPVGKVEIDYNALYSSGDKGSEILEVPQNPNNLSKEQVNEIGSKDYVKMYDYIGRLAVPIFSNYEYYDSRGEIENNNLSDSYNTIGPNGMYTELSGVSSEINVDELKNISKITEGEYFTKEDLKNGEFKILVSNKFAEKNKIGLGDNFKLKINYDKPFVMGDDLSKGEASTTAFEQPVPVGSEEYEFKVSGIFEVQNQPAKVVYSQQNQESFMKVSRYDQGNNAFKVPSETLEKMSLKSKEFYKEYAIANPEIITTDTENMYSVSYENYFFLNSNNDFEMFIKDANKVIGDEEFLKAYTNEKQFVKVVEPLQSMNKISSVTLISSIVFTIVILGLIVMLFTRDRKYEMGIYLSLGEKKIKVFSQLFFETLLVALVAITLGLISASILAPSVNESLLASQNKNNSQQDMMFGNPDQEMDPFIYSNYGSSSNVTVEVVEPTLTLPTIILFYGIGATTIFIATLIPGLYVLRLNPKKIMM